MPNREEQKPKPGQQQSQKSPGQQQPPQPGEEQPAGDYSQGHPGVPPKQEG
jgi:hypothetical protein